MRIILSESLARSPGGIPSTGPRCSQRIGQKGGVLGGKASSGPGHGSRRTPDIPGKSPAPDFLAEGDGLSSAGGGAA